MEEAGDGLRFFARMVAAEYGSHFHVRWNCVILCKVWFGMIYCAREQGCLQL